MSWWKPLVTVIALLFAAPGAIASAGCGRATGGVWYDAEGVERHAAFSARGQLQYNAEGAWYHARITEVAVSDNTAYFAGEVVSASDPSWVGKWAYAVAQDGGTPGRKGDKFYLTLTSEATAKAKVASMQAPPQWYSVIRGNLVVHGCKETGRPEWVPGPPDWNGKPPCTPGGPPGLCR